MSDLFDTVFLHMLNAALSQDSSCDTNSKSKHNGDDSDDDEEHNRPHTSIWRDQNHQEQHPMGTGGVAAELLYSSFSSRGMGELNCSFSYDRMHEESINNKKAWQTTALPQLQSHIRHTFGNETIDELMTNKSCSSLRSPSRTATTSRRGRSGSHSASPPRPKGHRRSAHTLHIQQSQV